MDWKAEYGKCEKFGPILEKVLEEEQSEWPEQYHFLDGFLYTTGGCVYLPRSLDQCYVPTTVPQGTPEPTFYGPNCHVGILLLLPRRQKN